MTKFLLCLGIAASSLLGQVALSATDASEPKIHSCVVRSGIGRIATLRFLGQGYKKRDALSRAMRKCHRNSFPASSCHVAYCTTAKVYGDFTGDDDSLNEDLDFSQRGPAAR